MSLVVGCWLLVVGFLEFLISWLFGCCALVCWLLVVECRLLNVGCLVYVVVCGCCLLFGVGVWLFVVRFDVLLFMCCVLRVVRWLVCFVVVIFSKKGCVVLRVSCSVVVRCLLVAVCRLLFVERLSWAVVVYGVLCGVCCLLIVICGLLLVVVWCGRLRRVVCCVLLVMCDVLFIVSWCLWCVV